MSRNFKFTLLSLLVLLVLAEVAMRIVFVAQGYTIGSLAPNWFPKVVVGEVPVLQPSYYSDSTGMFRASQSFWEDKDIAVNGQGFIGGEWRQTQKPGLLLIGDSFVWGAGADPITESFAAKLAKESGFEVYNAGIPGADPAQYQLVAERYVTALSPKVVVVCLYLGNDVVVHLREPQAYRALYFPSNWGWFPGYYQGRYFETLETSYQYYLKHYTPQDWYGRLVCHTAVGTAICALPLRLEEKRQRQAQLQSNTTNQHLKAIQAVCQQAGTQLLIVPIPYLGTDFAKPYHPRLLFELYANVFQGLEETVKVFPIPEAFFHPLPDGHFNNQGHRYMSQQIKKALPLL